MFWKLVAAVFALSAAFAGLALAHEYRLGDIVIEHPWATPSIGQARSGAVYLTIAAEAAQSDRLIGAATPAARMAGIHTHILEEGIVRMRPVQAIEIAPGAPVLLRPGGLHIMLMDLAAPLTVGQTFPLTLTFEKAGTIEIEVVVETPPEVDPHTGHMPGT
jgi:hypothetical protein